MRGFGRRTIKDIKSGLAEHNQMLRGPAPVEPPRTTREPAEYMAFLATDADNNLMEQIRDHAADLDDIGLTNEDVLRRALAVAALAPEGAWRTSYKSTPVSLVTIVCRAMKGREWWTVRDLLEVVQSEQPRITRDSLSALLRRNSATFERGGRSTYRVRSC